MFKAVKKISFGYLVFGLGFTVGVAFTAFLYGLYGQQIQPQSLPAPMQALTPS